MRCFSLIIAFFMCIFYFMGAGFCDEVWELVAGIKDGDIREVCMDASKEGVVYCSTLKRLYRTEDNGSSWAIVFSARGDGNIINFINVSKGGVFVCTEKGVYKSADGKSEWGRIFEGIGEENSVLHIAFSEDGRIYLGTKAGLFVSDDNGDIWQKDLSEAGNMDVKWVTFLEKDVFLVSEKGVYKSTRDGWERVFVTGREEVEYESDLTDSALKAVKPVNSMLVKGEILFLATDAWIFISEDRGNSWNKFNSDGLISQKVNQLLFKDNLCAATDKGVYIFIEKDKIWRALYKGMAATSAESIAVDNQAILWAVTDNGLYRTRFKNVSLLASTQESLKNEEEALLGLFDYEPSISEVQGAGIEYAEVHPDKIKEWRESAKKKAFLPTVSVGADRYVTDYYHWDTGSTTTPDVMLKGDDVVSWDVTMTWNLGELIWNDDQTSIDTRSRLMVQLRDDILDEITRTYFERRRLQLEMHLSPPVEAMQKLEKELRLQELTADLDALTGGYFSAQLKHE